MLKLLSQGWSGAALALMTVLLAGCASSFRVPAPVVERSTGGRVVERAVVAPMAPVAEPGKTPLLLVEGAPKTSLYTVRPGDTLIRIALDNGLNWRDLVRWNNIDNPDVIEVGQVLRVTAPSGLTGAPETVTVRPVTPPSVTSATVPPASAASAPRTLPLVATPAPAPAPTPAIQATPPAVAGDDDVQWGWPAPGNLTVLAGFDEIKNKGLDIAGKAGDPVLASADGRVVYAGAGLRGYGNLIILKHNNTYLTAYAHNQTLLVKEDFAVRKGQKIAEMGSSDADRVKLHFEIRRQGKPVDPARYLPAR